MGITGKKWQPRGTSAWVQTFESAHFTKLTEECNQLTFQFDISHPGWLGVKALTKIHNTWPGTFTVCGSPFISPSFLVNFLERYTMLEQMPDVDSVTMAFDVSQRV